MTAPPEGEDVPRVVGRLRGAAPGPTLLVVAGLHGNEPAGVRAARRVLASKPLHRGDLVVLGGNLAALRSDVRFIDRDLNRIWPAAPTGHEGQEHAGLSAAIDETLNAARGETLLLDLHTTSADGAPFLALTDHPLGRTVADAIPVTRLLGLVESLHGTLVDHMGSRGVPSLVLEAGRHDRASSVDVSEAALRLVMDALGLAPAPAASRELLARARGDLPAEIRVFHRHPIAPGDGFRMEPGFTHFQPVRKGQPLARDSRGPILCPEDAVMLLPLYQGQGEDGFFLGRPAG